MRIDWKNLKKFIDDTEIQHFLNYLELENETYVWIQYQGENFSCLLAKDSVDFEDFTNNYKSQAIVKNDIAADGFKFTKTTHVLNGRILTANFVLITTSTKNNNDKTGFVTIKLFDKDGNETNDGSLAVKTALDFEPNFDYEIYAGGLESIDVMTSDFYVSAIIAPTIPAEQGGCKYNIKNKLLLKPVESVFKKGIGPAELKYNAGLHTNLVRLEIDHDQGVENKFQWELQFYS